MTTVPRQRQSGVGCLTRLVLVFVVVGAVMWGAIWVFAPWGFYMGGRYHWYPSWQGWGRLHSNSGGGDYAVYIYIYPRGDRGMGRAHVSDLVLDDHSSIQRAFDHNATLYPEHASRPYLGEVSPITLHEGTKADFEAACAAVKSK